jgi:hypothetical protein
VIVARGRNIADGGDEDRTFAGDSSVKRGYTML